LGIHQLKKVWKFQEKRAQIAQYYNSQLSTLPLLLPPQAPHQSTPVSYNELPYYR
ncbi:MAG: hypothetical protein F6K41_44855, partial [Symploca sp. SIO3E6]|nr:hypothetical protein [Caldora sp. SIO3E6]